MKGLGLKVNLLTDPSAVLRYAPKTLPTLSQPTALLLSLVLCPGVASVSDRAQVSSPWAKWAELTKWKDR